MKKKTVVIIIILAVLILAFIPFRVKRYSSDDYLVDGRPAEYCYALLWQKDYVCIQTYNDGTVRMADRFRIAWFITVYYKEEVMMRTGMGLYPELRPEVVSHIPEE